ncbi:cst complex subunit ctc1 [Plakobranchus ocellatus]|uniref:Cst complex subunit ctc1 n=1 Tax=Plakobranchus ocellatus TaxID=259542 RepID=A0AAV3YDP5_9GAST|nr:cst complex subunit ctc1 [Plakobranchus ocellatus]
MEDVTNTMMTDEFLSAHDVAKLLELKSLFQHRLKVSFKGKVTSLSRIIRLKASSFFMIQVDVSVPILVKDFKLEWHSQLEPGESYLFHNMIMTTVEKGFSQARTVLSAWDDSHFSEIIENNNVITVPLQTWLMTQNITTDLPEFEDDGCDFFLTDDTDSCVNYEGIITSNEDAKDGFYTLDEKIRIRGISGVLHKESSQRETFQQIFCIKYWQSDAKEKLSRFEIPLCKKLFDPDRNGDCLPFERIFVIFWKRLIRGWRVPFKVLDSRSQEAADQTVKRLLGEKSLWQVPKKSKTLLDEFFNHQCLCPYASCNSNTCKVPKIMSLSVAKLLTNAVKNETQEQDISSRNDANCFTVCRCLQKESDQILAGSITLGSSGQLNFSDAKESLPLLILTRNKDKQNSPDASNWAEDCREDTSLEFGKHLPYSHLDSSIVGKLIFVREFHMIEEYQNSGRKDKDILVYLAFHLQDCVMIDQKDRETSNGILPVAKKLTRIRFKVPRGPDEKKRCHIHVTNKLSLCSASGNTETLEFKVLGYVLQEEDSESDQLEPSKPKRSTSEEEACSTVTHSDHPQVPLQHGHSLAFSNATEKHIVESPLISKAVLFIFSGVLSRFYHLIHPGNQYQVDSAQHCLLPSFSSAQLQKAAQHCRVPKEVRLPEDLRLHRITSSVPFGGESQFELAPSSIKDILSQSFSDSETVVSFQGCVESRCVSRSAFTNVRSQCLDSFSMNNICLHVRELSHDQTAVISLYISAPRNVYSLGLVPGAIIHFSCVERKVSQKGNVYCRFTSASSLEVLTLLPLDKNDRLNARGCSGKQLPAVTDLPKVLLADLWLTNLEASDAGAPIGRGPWVVECHICMFFKLRIKSECCACQGAIVCGQCQNSRCKSNGHGVLKTDAVVLVDDGSGQARVIFRGPNLIARLLTVSEEQWNDIISGLSGCGELLLTKDSQAPPLPEAQLLNNLSKSSLVRRPCRLAVSCHSSYQHSMNSMSLDGMSMN